MIEVKKNRLHYVDVMKGITMLLVVLHHVLWLMSERGSDGDMIQTLIDHQQIYVCFIMPAFFFITGYCSNFGKKISQFFVSNLKSLIIPSLTIGVLLELVHCRWDIWTYIKGSVYLGFFSFWFLYALFYSKLLYYVIYRYVPSIYLKLLLLCLMALGGALMSDVKIVRNFGMICQVFNLTIYLGIGNIVRNSAKENILITSGVIIYLCLIVLYLCGLIIMPCVTAAFASTLRLEPLHFLSAYSGCTVVYFISKQVGSSKMLETIGRYSLVVYILHCEFISFFLDMIGVEFINQLSNIATFGLVVAILVLAVSASCLFARLLNTKYLSWTLGKFTF